MMELRKGDKVSVTGTVKYTPDKGERVFVKVAGTGEELWVAQSAVKLVQQKFEIGDRVCFDVGEVRIEGEILSTSGEHAWIELSVDGSYTTRHFGSITRLSEPEVVDESLALANAHLDGYPIEQPPAPGSSD